MDAMKVNVCKFNMYTFHGFTVQKGMVFGWDEFNRPFVTNGRFYFEDESIPIYFLKCQDEFGKYVWMQPIYVKRADRQKLIDAIADKALKQTDGVQYLNMAQLEHERHKEKVRNKKSLVNGVRYRSTYLYYDAERRTGAPPSSGSYIGHGAVTTGIEIGSYTYSA
jgi:hypothetical protein